MARLSSSPPSSPLGKGARLALWALAATAATLLAAACCFLASGKYLLSTGIVPGSLEQSETAKLPTARAGVWGASDPRRQSETRLLSERGDSTTRQPLDEAAGGGGDATAAAGDGGGGGGADRSLNRPPGRSLRKRTEGAKRLHTIQAGEDRPDSEAAAAAELEGIFPMSVPPKVEVGYRGGFEGFPPLEDSTLMFMHVFKCAGSTLRCVATTPETLVDESMWMWFGRVRM